MQEEEGNAAKVKSYYNSLLRNNTKSIINLTLHL